MIQIPNLAKTFLLSGCGALAAWAVLTLPDNARASARAPSVVTLPGRSFSRAELDNGRNRLLAINDAFVELAAVLQNPRVTAISTENRGNILTMDDKNLAVLALCEPYLIRLQAAVETMRSTIVGAATGAGAHTGASGTPGCPNPNAINQVGPPSPEEVRAREVPSVSEA
jgi:hypothetical protein